MLKSLSESQFYLQLHHSLLCDPPKEDVYECTFPGCLAAMSRELHHIGRHWIGTGIYRPGMFARLNTAFTHFDYSTDERLLARLLVDQLGNDHNASGVQVISFPGMNLCEKQAEVQHFGNTSRKELEMFTIWRLLSSAGIITA